jgi:hypothetical protein
MCLMGSLCKAQITQSRVLLVRQDLGHAARSVAGASARSWFLDMIIVLGALTAVGIIAALVDTSLLRRKPSRSRRGPPRCAEPELATRIGDTGKTDYTPSQTLSSQARTTKGI